MAAQSSVGGGVAAVRDLKLPPPHARCFLHRLRMRERGVPRYLLRVPRAAIGCAAPNNLIRMQMLLGLN
jgi:hypothetical protein